MKFAALFSIALATQAYDYAKVDPTSKCMTLKTVTGVPSTTLGISAAIQESFKDFKFSATQKTAYQVTTSVKKLPAKEKNIDDLEINVTMNLSQDPQEANQLRAMALLNIVGTLNLNYPLNEKPLWRAKINLKTSSPEDVIPSGTYSRESKFVQVAGNLVLGRKPSCAGPILK